MRVLRAPCETVPCVEAAHEGSIVVDGARARILVVDDEENLRLTLCQAFRMEGYEVAGAADSQEAMRLLETERFDVVLTDLMLPTVDGLSLLERAKAIHPSPAIVLMTGQATVESAIRALKGGAFDYVLKPFRLDEIFHVVTRGIEQQRLRRENVQLTAINQRLQEVDRIKSDILSAVTHEFRTPLTIIYGWLEILLGDQCGSLTPGQRESVQAIREGALRLGRLISNILAFVEHEQGGVDFRGEEVKLAPLLHLIVDELAQKATEKRVTLEIRDGVGGVRLWGNPGKLRLLFFNLMENAVKFNRADGKVLVDATQHRWGSEIRVTNTDGEIPPGRLEQIQEAFTQGEMGLARAAGGLGLGLNVAKVITAAYGGELSFESGQGRGTTVTVRFPRRPARVVTYR